MTEEFDFNRVPGKNPHTVKTKYIKKEKELITHLEKLWCAMFVSEGWYEMWRHHNDNTYQICGIQVYRQYALKCKAIGIVEFDRILNNYETSMKMGEDIPASFVYGEY